MREKKAEKRWKVEEQMDPSWPRKQEFSIGMCASLFHDFQNAAQYTHYLKELSASVSHAHCTS